MRKAILTLALTILLSNTLHACIERARRDEQIRETIMTKLIESGEKDRLKEMLRDKLLQCGWRDDLKEYCKDVIR